MARKRSGEQKEIGRAEAEVGRKKTESYRIERSGRKGRKSYLGQIVPGRRSRLHRDNWTRYSTWLRMPSASWSLLTDGGKRDKPSGVRKDWKNVKKGSEQSGLRSDLQSSGTR